ncbi:MAG: PDZ domain-containing protein [Candidatus Omnitrophica bacterium]|nr:PDZ domain-containing protein [Candidatus Omnitrophota bacterium]
MNKKKFTPTQTKVLAILQPIFQAICEIVDLFVHLVVTFAKKSPVYFAGTVIAGILIFLGLLGYLRAQEILPEGQEPKEVAAPASSVVKKGGSMFWIGMELAPLSGTLRKDFKIDGKVKGMFVVNEGNGLGGQFGIKTGDVIVAVSRKPVPSSGDFIKMVNSVGMGDGVLLDIYRDGKNLYITVPFKYQYGPLMGSNQGKWQLGGPIFGQAVPYGKIIK